MLTAKKGNMTLWQACSQATGIRNFFVTILGIFMSWQLVAGIRLFSKNSIESKFMKINIYKLI